MTPALCALPPGTTSTIMENMEKEKSSSLSDNDERSTPHVIRITGDSADYDDEKQVN